MNVAQHPTARPEGQGGRSTGSNKARLSGRQAIVQLAVLQHRLDKTNGLNTAGFVTGYRGSPLGGVDQAFEAAKKQLDQEDIRFLPGVNEDLAATAVLGTQQINLFPNGTRQGVFAMWYAKGPGVDRSGDALRHGNLAGSARYGGVLLLAGDDHACKSSTTSHQSEYALMDAMIPTLNPSGLGEVISFGLFGWALSRYSGCWSAMKLTADAIDASALVNLDLSGFFPKAPANFEMPDVGLGIRWPDSPQQAERRLHNFKLPAAKAFARANGIDRIVLRGERRRLGIVTTGKSYLDVLQALEALGISDARGIAAGISIFKVGMVWPLEPEAISDFARSVEEIVIVEEKRTLIESQLKDLLYNLPVAERPRIVGKRDLQGKSLLPAHDDLSSQQVALALGEQIAIWDGMSDVAERVARLRDLDSRPAEAAPIARTPYFCSGCPHSTSTHVPEGSRAFAGIGCHWMVQSMDRNTATYTHMGGEGANWIGQAPFVDTLHVFQNMGDGTYFHSGLLAIRAAVAAKVNITYKILFNDATAMTGGQRHDGVLTPQRISKQLRAEGVERIVVVADDVGKYKGQESFAEGVTIHSRRDLDPVQRKLREVKGVSALIYDQVCAAEKRRRRKQDVYAPLEKRVFINEMVCEGCGDCSAKSNCLSVVPVETEFGRKRRIDQSSCNQDFSCVEGFCPSFVTIEGVKARRSQKGNPNDIAVIDIPEPQARPCDRVWNVLVTGIGGTGVVTIGAVLSRAALLEGKQCSTFEMTGMAQKGGPVASHIRFSDKDASVNGARIPMGAADVILGCDLVVSAGKEAISAIDRGRTRILLNDASAMIPDAIRDPDFDLPAKQTIDHIRNAAGSDQVEMAPATRVATDVLGDAISANLFMVGYAYQRGLIPVSSDSILQAIAENKVGVSAGQTAFRLGRLAAADFDHIKRLSSQFDASSGIQTVDELVSQRAKFLTGYQDARYANGYLSFVERVAKAETEVTGAKGKLTEAVARYLFKLMAYKDEYEVARLYTDKGFREKLSESFEGKGKISFYMAPAFLPLRRGADGHPVKLRLGGWMFGVLSVLAALRRLRGTPFDPFGYLQDHRAERALIEKYMSRIEEALPLLSLGNIERLVAFCQIPESIRGFGHVKNKSILKVNKFFDENPVNKLE